MGGVFSIPKWHMGSERRCSEELRINLARLVSLLCTGIAQHTGIFVFCLHWNAAAAAMIWSGDLGISSWMPKPLSHRGGLQEKLCYANYKISETLNKSRLWSRKHRTKSRVANCCTASAHSIQHADITLVLLDLQTKELFTWCHLECEGSSHCNYVH